MSNLQKISRIMVIRQDHLGDLILTTPLFRALSMAGYEVIVICRRSSLPVLLGNPNIKQLLALEEVAPKYPKNFFDLGYCIRKLSPDIVLIPHAKPLALLLGVRSGYFGLVLAMWGGVASRLLLCRSIRSGLPNNLRHYTEIILDMAQVLGVSSQGVNPEIFLTKEEKDEGKSILKSRFGLKKIVIIHPGCGGSACNLPIESYSKLIDILLDNSDVTIVITGVVSEREIYSGELSRFELNPRVWNSMGSLTLRQLCGVISQSNMVVSSSTGPLHIAASLKIPTVTTFCTKRSLCSRVWGNLQNPCVAIEPPEKLCIQQGNGTHCDFKGFITAEVLSESVFKIMTSIKHE